MIDNQRLERIKAAPGRATMDDVRWLCQLCESRAALEKQYAETVSMWEQAEEELTQLRADYAGTMAQLIKAEEEIQRLNSRLTTAIHKAASYADRVLCG